MPIYEYRCDECSNELEELISIANKDKLVDTLCSEVFVSKTVCNGKLQLKPSHFRGIVPSSRWYQDGFEGRKLGESKEIISKESAWELHDRSKIFYDEHIAPTMPEYLKNPGTPGAPKEVDDFPPEFYAQQKPDGWGINHPTARPAHLKPGFKPPE